MAQIVDLAAAITTETEVIGQPRVILEPIHTHEEHGRANTEISMTLHTGTHVDALLHFDHNGIDIEDLLLDRLIGLRNKAKAKTTITAEDIRRSPDIAETLADLIVIFQTGWNKKAFKKTNNYTDNPYLNTETARWSVEQGIRVLALDTPQGKYSGMLHHEDFPVHRFFLERRIPFIEHLHNLNQINRNRIQMIALPIKGRGAEGILARVIAILD